MRNSSNIISVCLIGSGLAAWGLTARPLAENPELDVPLNPMGIKRSPYGEVFAMAMQSPINSYFHAAMGEKHSHAPGEACTDECTTSKDKKEEEHEEEHVHDEHCDHDHDPSHDHHAHDEEHEKSLSVHDRLLGLIEMMNEVSELRTNPKPASEALKFHHRRAAEDKLRFAYEMDPAHYGNYNSLHFFLTEPQFGTRPQMTPAVIELARETMEYCNKQDNDPRPALTGAAACTNILDLMFMDHNHNKSSTFTVAQMRDGLSQLDYFLNRYNKIAMEWEKSKNWELLSPMRIAECQTRYRFILKIRETAAVTIARLETEAKAAQ